ncbi:PTS sugar transporter subunit IIB [Malacoplasma penetrans]|uniref:PTS EIIB type-2 domain-containing protein n=1 Tax=Malacoplasma penetrans (strain HF-2) TaxID=272633 RepID=Q8EVW0_MALP2|nr:PTS sugar transporter subunit IIB [Malacoplasma penetrans]RXY97241.1 PTS sugar transporter subunit IIB [Malacoplasma penetrans]BAC44239.1 conserved hypothetical protein [Malacoplasma penetrans HF-2]
MKKICTVCGQGLGSSLIVEMNIKNVISELGLTDNDVQVTHKNLNSYSPSDGFDYIICGIDLADSIDAGSGQKIALENLLNVDELKSKLLEIFKGDK